MIKLYEHGAYLLNGTEIIEDVNDAQAAPADMMTRMRRRLKKRLSLRGRRRRHSRRPADGRSGMW